MKRRRRVSGVAAKAVAPTALWPLIERIPPAEAGGWRSVAATRLRNTSCIYRVPGARVQFPSVTRTQSVTFVGSAGIHDMLTGIFKDIRFALRQFSKAKGFLTAAVLTLALGIGANTAIFTLIHAIMFKSLAVSVPETLIRLGDSDNCCVIGGFQGR